jgi:hypothetical protein
LAKEATARVSSNNYINSNSSTRSRNLRKQLVLVVLPPVLQPVLPSVLPPVLVFVHMFLLNSSIRRRQGMGASRTTSSKKWRRFLS